MSPAPRLIAIGLVVGASLWTLAITTAEGEPFATDAAVLVSIGLLMFAVIAAVGLLIPRGRWARNLARGLLAFEIGLAAVAPFTGWAIAALIATGLGIVGAQGRWLDGWLRRLPAAQGPGLKAMLFLLGNLALVPAIGLSSPQGVHFQQGLLAATGILIAWGYSKAKLWSIWAGRFLILPLSIAAALVAPVAGQVFLLAIGACLTWLAWTDETRFAISPLLDQLPGPRTLSARDGGSE